MVADNGRSSRLSMGKRAAMVGAAVSAALVPAGAAHAGVIGIGDSAFGNTCTNLSGAHPAGSTAVGSGLGGGNTGQLPLDLPRNRCGNSGIICNVQGLNGFDF